MQSAPPRALPLPSLRRRRGVSFVRASSAADVAPFSSASERYNKALEESIACEARLDSLQAQLDELYRSTFGSAAPDEAAFAALGREQPAAFNALLAESSKTDRRRYAAFTSAAQRLSVEREATQRELRAGAAALQEHQHQQQEEEEWLQRRAAPARLYPLPPRFSCLSECLNVLRCAAASREVGRRAMMT
jgi:hypothetical protein